MFNNQNDYGGPPSEQADPHRLEKTSKLSTPKSVRRIAMVLVAFVAMVGAIGFIYWRKNAGTFQFNWMEQQKVDDRGLSMNRSALGLDQKPDLGTKTAGDPPADPPPSTLPTPTQVGDNTPQKPKPGWVTRRPDFSFKNDPNWQMWQYKAASRPGGGSQAAAGTRGGEQQYAASEAADGTEDGAGGAQGGYSGQRSGGKRNSAQEFYNGGNTRADGNDGLDHKYAFRPELKGCVLKAGDKIKVQSEDTLEATLPGEVTLKTFDPVWGQRFLRGGRVERCLWAQPASTVILKANVQGLERGQVRVQVCATRLDKRGGGRINLGCMNGYDRDGSSGLRAIADRDYSGAITGLLFEGALTGFRAAANGLIGGTGSAVTVALGDITQGSQELGREFITEELRKPAKLTVYGGNVFFIKANADISDIPQNR